MAEPDRRRPVLRALRELTDSRHPDVTPATVSRACGAASDYAWRELARCQADGLAACSAAFLCTWRITEEGRRWLAAAEAPPAEAPPTETRPAEAKRKERAYG